jgi:hypothetical protein
VKTISGAPLQTSQGPGPITAFAGAPAGALVYVAGGGLIGTNANTFLSAAGNLAAVNVQAFAVAGTAHGFQIRGGVGAIPGALRWGLWGNNAAETGADAGTTLELRAYTDAGASIDYPLSIIRAAAGLITIGGALNNRPITLTPPNQGLRINNQVTGAGVGAGTLLNAPAAGNPAFWCPISIAGVVRFFPCW